jgi:hypothetical protein
MKREERENEYTQVQVFPRHGKGLCIHPWIAFVDLSGLANVVAVRVNTTCAVPSWALSSKNIPIVCAPVTSVPWVLRVDVVMVNSVCRGTSRHRGGRLCVWQGRSSSS